MLKVFQVYLLEDQGVIEFLLFTFYCCFLESYGILVLLNFYWTKLKGYLSYCLHECILFLFKYFKTPYICCNNLAFLLKHKQTIPLLFRFFFLRLSYLHLLRVFLRILVLSEVRAFFGTVASWRTRLLIVIEQNDLY